MPSQNTPLPTPGDLATARFHVLAEASPGLLPRLLQPLAKRDLTPDAFHAIREGALLRVEFTLHAMPAEMLHLVAGNLGQVIGVAAVQMHHDGDTVMLAA